jgi:RNA polymerase sigma-70 factor, ECF subfamily
MRRIGAPAPPGQTTVLTASSPHASLRLDHPAFLETGYDGTPFPSPVCPDERPEPPAQADNTPAELALEMQSTVDLLAQARAGDARAVDVLFARCVPPLRRWARGRLPTGARSVLETQDLVQDAVYHVLQRLDKFEARHQGALQAYLRQAVLNHIRDEARRLARRPTPVEFEDHHPDAGASPLEQAIDRDDLERYEAALARLRPIQREAIIARIEMQNTYEEIARALGRPNANAARSLVVRALYKLYEEMGHGA